MIRLQASKKLLPQILSSVVPITVIALFCVWLIASTQIRNTLERDANKRFENSVQHTAAMLGESIDLAINTARGLAKSDLIRGSLSSLEDSAGHVDILFRSLRMPGATEARISLVDDRGRIVASNLPGPSYERAEWLGDLGKRGEVINIMQTGMIFAIPTHHAGIGKGSIVVEYEASHLAALFETHPEFTTYAITDQSGSTVYSSTPDFPEPGAPVTTDRDPGWNSKAVSVSGYPKYRIVIGEQKSATSTPASGLKMHMLVIIILSVVGTVVGVTAAAFMATKPVSNLVKIIRHIRETGNLEHRVEPSGSVEFRALAESFNDMLARLQSTLVSLDIVEETNNSLKREIAARKRAESELVEQATNLRRSNAELQQFAYVASHDLKAPLRAIDSIASWVEEDLQTVMDQETRGNLGLLRGRINRMENLLNDLLDYSRADRGMESADLVDSGDVAQDAFSLVDAPDGFSLDVSDAMPVFDTARTPLHQVFHNLISNAIKHHDQPEGSISISAKPIGAFFEFTVNDDGPGISPEYHERIFKMFQTLRPRDEVEGSGMGLALVKKIVESANGSIVIHSTPGERGSRFVFLWPREWDHKSADKTAA